MSGPQPLRPLLPCRVGTVAVIRASDGRCFCVSDNVDLSGDRCWGRGDGWNMADRRDGEGVDSPGYGEGFSGVRR